MRPGYLGSLDDFWFGNLGGKYFEILDANSAHPIYTIRNRVRGKTGEEFASLVSPGWSTTNTPEDAFASEYQNDPYWNSDSGTDINNMIDAFKEKSQVFKLR